MKRIIIITLFLIISFTISCEEEQSPTEIINQEVIDNPEAIVRSNALILQQAVHSFSEEITWGNCPGNIYNDTTECGKCLVDFLPGGELLLNPYTGERNLPIDTTATQPGEIGYKTLSFPCGRGMLYTITGFGEDSLIIELSNTEEVRNKIIMNCYIAADAAEQFAIHNFGLYPTDNTSVDTLGLTVVDHLPGGEWLINPYTGMRTEPAVWGGSAALPGETGYNPIYAGGTIAGYNITGTDHKINFVIIICRGPYCD
jgi:hypothetical protein